MKTILATNQTKLPIPPSQRSIVLRPEEAFELWADVYDDSPNPIVQRSERAIIERITDLRELRVADLACGTGRLLPKLLDLVPKTCVGVDSSNAMLQKARTKTEAAGRLIQADIHDLPFLSGSMDFVTFSLGLSYCRSLIQVAQEIQRILKPGGRLLCTDFHPIASETGWKRNFRIKTSHYEVCHFPRPVRDVLLEFGKYFHVVYTSDLFFGEAERPVFERAGKSLLFEELSQRAALILFEWEKPASTCHTDFKK